MTPPIEALLLGFAVQGLVSLLIVLIVGGAIWWIFTLVAAKVGLPDIIVQIVTVVIVVILAIVAIRFLASLIWADPGL